MGSKRIICFILCCGAFLGIGGLHDFYLKRWKWGIIKLLTLDFLWLGAIYDLLMIILNKYEGLEEAPASAPTKRISDEVIQKAVEESIEKGQFLSRQFEWSVGSENQITWADEILQRFVKKANKLIADSYEKGKITEQEGCTIKDKVTEAIYEHDDANWWIDTRNDSLEDRLKEMLDNDTEAIEIIEKMAE